MGMTLAYGKVLSWSSETDKIGLDTVVTYKDQNGVEAKIIIKKFVELAERCQDPEHKKFFSHWISLIKNNDLSIGVPIIDGLNRIVSELGEQVNECIEGKHAK